MEANEEQSWALQLKRDQARRTSRPITDMRAGQITQAIQHYLSVMEEAHREKKQSTLISAAQQILQLKAELIAMVLAKEAALYGEPRKETINTLMDQYGELVATLEHDIGSPLASSFA